MNQTGGVRNERGSVARGVLAAGVAWGLVLAFATLRPGAGASVRPFMWCLRCGELGGRDVVLNVVAFIPLGFLLSRGTKRWWVGALAALALSLLAEGAQATVVPGRDPSLSDILTNTAGGIVGASLATVWSALRVPTPRLARALAATGALLWLAAMSVAAQAMRRSTGAPEYWGQWAHVWPRLRPFRGHVYSFTVDGLRVPDDRVAAPGTIRAMSVGDSVEVAATARPAAPPDGLAPIVSVSNETRGVIFLIGQDHRDLVFRMRTRAADAGFATPRFRLADTFPACASLCDSAQTMSIRASVSARAITLSATTADGADVSERFRLDPMLAWSALAPGEPALTRATALVGPLLSALALALVAYWAGRSAAASRRAPLLAALLALVAAGLAVPALLAGVAVPGTVDWLVCGAGAVAGLAVSARARTARALEAARAVTPPPAA